MYIKPRVTRKSENKFAHFFQIEAQTVSKPKKAKISTTKLSLKAQNIYYFKTLNYLQQTMF